MQGIQRNGKLYAAMPMGDADKNHGEIERTGAAINNPVRFHAFEYPGGREWVPKDVFEQAIG